MQADSQLLHAWRDGDESAAAELFRRHFRPLYRFMRGKLERSAEDLCQETFVRCLDRSNQFRGDSSFRTFLFAVARNVLTLELRRLSKGTDNPDLGVTSLSDFGVRPTDVLAEQSQRRRLLESLRRLPVDGQILIELYYFENLTAEELGGVLGLSEAAVRSRLHRTKRQLLGYITDAGSSSEEVRANAPAFDEWARGVRALFDESADPPPDGDESTP